MIIFSCVSFLFKKLQRLQVEMCGNNKALSNCSRIVTFSIGFRPLFFVFVFFLLNFIRDE